MAGRYRGTNPPVRMGDERRGLLGSRLYGTCVRVVGGSYDTPDPFPQTPFDTSAFKHLGA